MPKYFQIETPIAVNTEGGSIEYYPEAKRLVLALPPWFNSKGEKCRGKTVGLSIEPFKSQYQQVIDLLDKVIAELQKGDKE
jgi:hypothetical protein